jgi:hypothetical protein
VPERMFSCGGIQPGNLRLLRNAALEIDYRCLVKQALLIDLPNNMDVRVCVRCLVKMEKVRVYFVVFNGILICTCIIDGYILRLSMPFETIPIDWRGFNSFGVLITSNGYPVSGKIFPCMSRTMLIIAHYLE